MYRQRTAGIKIDPMRGFRQSSVRTLLILSAAVFLRAIIPAGYMAAAGGSGLLFEFCPEGVSAEFMEMVTGGTAHDHGEHDNADDDHHCPIGHMLLSAAAVDDAWQVDVAPAGAVFSIVNYYSFTSASRTHYYSRGPPA